MIRSTPAVQIFSAFLMAALIGACTAASADEWLDRVKEAVAELVDEQRPLSTDEVGGGLKEALRVGTETVVGNLGKTDGFNLDPIIHIPLPDDLDKVRQVLVRVGMESMLDDLETRLNRAAEVATPKAKQLFFAAIKDMTLQDVIGIYNGPEDAATQYFMSKMSAPLATMMNPIVEESLADVGAAQSYESLMARYNSIPFVPQAEADLSDYVVAKGMDGIFYYLAKEEAAIRKDPAKRTTDILKRVFGG